MTSLTRPCTWWCCDATAFLFLKSYLLYSSRHCSISLPPRPRAKAPQPLNRPQPPRWRRVRQVSPLRPVNLLPHREAKNGPNSSTPPPAQSNRLALNLLILISISRRLSRILKYCIPCRLELLLTQCLHWRQTKVSNRPAELTVRSRAVPRRVLLARTASILGTYDLFRDRNLKNQQVIYSILVSYS